MNLVGCAFAYVQSISAAGVSLAYDGEDGVCAPVGWIEPYSPSVGDRVLVLRFVGGSVVIGKVR